MAMRKDTHFCGLKVLFMGFLLSLVGAGMGGLLGKIVVSAGDSDPRWATPVFVACGSGAGGIIGAIAGLIDTLEAMHNCERPQ